MSGKCSCVTGDGCEAPANGPGTVKTKCFACGCYVCRECSRIQDWHRWTRKRVCDRCRADEERTR